VAAGDEILRGRLHRAVDRFSSHRSESLTELRDPDGLRHTARAMKAAILADLPRVLDRLADSLLASGAHVHWAGDADDANRHITSIVLGAGRRTGVEKPLVVKSKSMATEETGLAAALGQAGATVVETDLGEWIIQLADEPPSHIIAPAVHHDRYSIRDVFVNEAAAPPEEVPAVPEALNAFARSTLRERFLRADVGITGANFAVAETGSIVLVTNEGNGRLVTSVPPVHVVLLGAERVVENWDQLDVLLTMLTRSATGQRLTSYTSIVTGPRRVGEPEGPSELHVVILDNGRSSILGTAEHEMLACIRCGACLNVCPVYRQVGGHAYGGTYSGPMGAVLTPLLSPEVCGSAEVPNASTLCGACMQACPVEIPLQDLLLSLRRRRATGEASRVERAGWRAWSEAWSRRAGYEASTRAAVWGRGLGRHARLVPGGRQWTEGRAAPAIAKERFRDRWRRRGEQ
jgi:L-lactate dehydrogenase complex protein LldF